MTHLPLTVNQISCYCFHLTLFIQMTQYSHFTKDIELSIRTRTTLGVASSSYIVHGFSTVLVKTNVWMNFFEFFVAVWRVWLHIIFALCLLRFFFSFMCNANLKRRMTWIKYCSDSKFFSSSPVPWKYSSKLCETTMFNQHIKPQPWRLHHFLIIYCLQRPNKTVFLSIW